MDKPDNFKTENDARKWAKKHKLKVKCVEYVRGGARVQVARKKKCYTLRVNDIKES